MVDVSVSGASVLAHTDVSLRQGSHVVVGYEHDSISVVIRRISHTGRDDDRTVYGIEFIDAPAQMVSKLMERATGRGNEEREERWNKSG